MQMVPSSHAIPSGLASSLRKLSSDREPSEVANKTTAHLYTVNPLKDIKGRVNKLRLFNNTDFRL